MNKTESKQKALFENVVNQNENMNLVIEDKEEKQKYLLHEMKNKVILGDTFKILKKIDDEIFDVVFIDPPYLLQLPNKEL